MNIVIVIGTRPQYIKLKSLYDYLKYNKINNYIIDTNQHYSDNMSKNLIRELNLCIDENLNIKSSNEIDFISKGIPFLYNVIKNLSDKDKIDCIIVMGDTNSTLIASIVANKMGIKLAHIEAGVRFGDKKISEEMNRILIDNLADIHFLSREKDKINVDNPVYIGDLEYNYLNSIENNYDEDISYNGSIIMTIHRQENMYKERLEDIFSLCSKIKDDIIFPIHHRTKLFLFNINLSIPDNVEVVEPFSYKKMILSLRKCKGIISDSGSIIKISPFFGKKCIIPLDKIEWDEVLLEGYATNELNYSWFDDYKIERDMDFYYVENSCDIIMENLSEISGSR